MSAAKKTFPNRRNGDLAMIHIAAKRLFGDVSKGSDGRTDYEDWLERHTGKRSAGKLTVAERIELIKTLRQQGLVPEKGRGGYGQTAGGEDRPTSAQWAKIGGLSRDLGWDGLEDARLQTFVKRTAKISNARFLSRAKATDVITGLERWVRQGNAEGVPDAMS